MVLYLPKTIIFPFQNFPMNSIYLMSDYSSMHIASYHLYAIASKDLHVTILVVLVQWSSGGCWSYKIEWKLSSLRESVFMEVYHVPFAHNRHRRKSLKACRVVNVYLETQFLDLDEKVEQWFENSKPYTKHVFDIKSPKL